MKQLMTEREFQKVLERVRFKPITQDIARRVLVNGEENADVAQLYGLTRQRVHKIKLSALEAIHSEPADILFKVLSRKIEESALIDSATKKRLISAMREVLQD